MDRRTFLILEVPVKTDEQMFWKIKVSDRAELERYKNRNFSVKGADNLFIDIKKVLNIFSKYRMLLNE